MLLSVSYSIKENMFVSLSCVLVYITYHVVMVLFLYLYVVMVLFYFEAASYVMSRLNF